MQFTRHWKYLSAPIKPSADDIRRPVKVAYTKSCGPKKKLKRDDQGTQTLRRRPKHPCAFIKRKTSTQYITTWTDDQSYVLRSSKLSCARIYTQIYTLNIFSSGFSLHFHPIEKKMKNSMDQHQVEPFNPSYPPISSHSAPIYFHFKHLPWLPQ